MFLKYVVFLSKLKDRSIVWHIMSASRVVCLTYWEVW